MSEPIMPAKLVASILGLLALAGPALGQAGSKVVPPEHGMVLATCMEVAPGRLKDTTRRSDTTNYVYRGRVVSLDKDRSVSLCFDTDLMRVAGAWVGKPVAYAADKNMGPAVEGQMVFATRPGPGWAKDGQWDDPRPDGEGPLPRDWAHYRGLYLHGDKVVLSYTVGDCSVLELPGCVRVGERLAITRTLQFGPSSRPNALLICEEPAAKGSVGTLRAGGEYAQLVTAAERVVAAVTGAPPGTAWDFTGARLVLKLPAMPKGGGLRITIARLPAGTDLAGLVGVLKADVEDVRPMIKGGPPRWTQVVETKGTVALAGKARYALDDVGLPLGNPWHGSVRFGGLDFFPDGRAALCTWDGDVWIVDGLDGKLDRVRWKRFAAGLQQPLGLKIVAGVIYTAGRDQITRLHDLNGDGEADFFENFNNDAALTLQRHEFVMDLQADAQGNLYFGRSGHYVASKRGANCCIYKLSPDGARLEVFARGFREPNGLSIGPDRTMIVGDNEGNGVPQTPLYRLERGGFYGYRPSESEALGVKGARWEYARKPIVWLPKNVDRSAGSQVWVTDERFGLPPGQLLHTSYGHCALYSVLIDRKAEPWQGAVWKFPLGFASGVMRARFSPKDGQLYLCGLRGWDTNAVRDGQFCRVRFTGTRVPVPVGFEVVASGLRVPFSDPLDRAAAEDDENWTGEWSNPIAQPGLPITGKQELPIKAVQLSPDGRTVTVQLEQVRPTANFTLQYRLKSAAGAGVSGELHGTIHRVPR